MWNIGSKSAEGSAQVFDLTGAEGYLPFVPVEKAGLIMKEQRKLHLFWVQVWIAARREK